ncbi:hypothetical protein GCM10009836_18920 [Pseudonocardia ailaonensis]|uniref:Amidohydrolase-related domain-containing protein n=1 Tax=Pseudonocardia ailaonensis TaxID=367279 RepID=A0ABN2MYC1_9PSEU
MLPMAAGQGAFPGAVWLEDGLVAAVTRGADPGPPGFTTAPVVDVGDSLVLPGLIDLHNHLAYDTLPLWTVPGRTTPFAHHDSWPRAANYAPEITWPASALVTACPEELLARVEVGALVGGTTTVQGSPPKNRPLDGWLVRNAEDETFGIPGGASFVFASVLQLDAQTLASRATAMAQGSTFVYHCAEGAPGSLVRREFTDAKAAGCLRPGFVAVHANAIGAADFAGWADPGAIVWSPFSNLWLYGETTDVPAARAAGIGICLGADWAPSGTRHVLGELKVARVVSDDRGWGLTDEDLVAMVTSTPGDVLARSWPRAVGRLVEGALGDVLVLRADPGTDPFTAVVDATERDVELVVIDGRPRYGLADRMRAADADPVTPIEVAGQDRLLCLVRPDEPGTGWEWADVLARLEAVRADPAGEIAAADQASAGPGGFPPLRLRLDMPTGEGPTAGLPEDLSHVVVPAIVPLVHDDAWLDAVAAGGFHGGLLTRLDHWYRP